MVGQGAALVAALAIGLLAEIAWLAFFHESPEHLIGGMVVGSGIPLLALTLNVAVRPFRRDADQ